MRIGNEPQPYLNRLCCLTQGGCCSAHGTGGAPRCPRGARSRLRRLLVLLGLVPYVRCAATALRHAATALRRPAKTFPAKPSSQVAKPGNEAIVRSDGICALATANHAPLPRRRHAGCVAESGRRCHAAPVAAPRLLAHSRKVAELWLINGTQAVPLLPALDLQATPSAPPAGESAPAPGCDPVRRSPALTARIRAVGR